MPRRRSSSDTPSSLLTLALIIGVFYYCFLRPTTTKTTTADDNDDDKKLVKVTIANGEIIGEKISVDVTNKDRGRGKVEVKQLNRFLSIPYAQPPIGQLRFRRSLPIVEKWSHPVQALQWPPQCVQSRENWLNEKWGRYFKNTNISEDCLYLNIWSPASTTTNDDQTLRPVLVWIHGGGLIAGTSSLELYDGEMLAAKADAVVVTINYRLSILGFLYSEKVSDVRGNQGLWDQTLALEWIQDNIRYFGGNPRAVTIMGQSAGSWSVSLHLLSPVSRNLFHNAILMSGAALNGVVMSNDPDAEYAQHYLSGIRRVGCATEQDTSIDDRIIECLQHLPAEQVEKIYYLTTSPSLIPKLVVVDGEFLPASPETMLAAGDFKTPLNLLVSTVTDEGSFILPRKFPTLLDTTRSFSLSEAKNYLHKFAQNYLKTQSIEYDDEQMEKLYLSDIDGSDGKEDNGDLQNWYRKQIGIAAGDLILTCPTLTFAKAIKQYATTTTITAAAINIYQWYYSPQLDRNSVQLLCTEPWTDMACHCDELFALFGMPFRFPPTTAAHHNHQREREISNEIINFVASFIRTGTPGEKYANEWLPYFFIGQQQQQEQQLVAPYYAIFNFNNNFAHPLINYGFNFKQYECKSASLDELILS